MAHPCTASNASSTSDDFGWPILAVFARLRGHARVGPPLADCLCSPAFPFLSLSQNLSLRTVLFIYPFSYHSTDIFGSRPPMLTPFIPPQNSPRCVYAQPPFLRSQCAELPLCFDKSTNRGAYISFVLISLQKTGVGPPPMFTCHNSPPSFSRLTPLFPLDTKVGGGGASLLCPPSPGVRVIQASLSPEVLLARHPLAPSFEGSFATPHSLNGVREPCARFLVTATAHVLPMSFSLLVSPGIQDHHREAKWFLLTRRHSAIQALA